ncbi:MAG: hypothetical protein WBP56_24305 [Polyangia bacterium]
MNQVFARCMFSSTDELAGKPVSVVTPPELVAPPEPPPVVVEPPDIVAPPELLTPPELVVEPPVTIVEPPVLDPAVLVPPAPIPPVPPCELADAVPPLCPAVFVLDELEHAANVTAADRRNAQRQ